MTLFAQPIGGVISDRWRSKLGRRALWIIAGAVAGALFMVGLRYSTNLALIAAFWVAGLLFGVIGLNAYFVSGSAVSIGAILFVLLASDRSSENLELPPFSWGGFFKSFINPLRDHDFRWVWLARFPFMFG